jgi:hypothetical protein
VGGRRCLGGPHLGLGDGTGGGAEPHVDRTGFGRVEGAGRPGGVVLDPPYAKGVLVGEPLGAEEIQEDRTRLRVPPRAHLDLNLVLDQEMPVPEHVVDGLHLEVHVAKARLVAAEDG